MDKIEPIDFEPEKQQHEHLQKYDQQLPSVSQDLVNSPALSLINDKTMDRITSEDRKGI